MDKFTVPEVLPLVRALYATPHGAVGGHLHVVLDDPNYEDGVVDACIERAAADKCSRCYALALILRRMSKTQRSRLARIGAYKDAEGWD